MTGTNSQSTDTQRILWDISELAKKLDRIEAMLNAMKTARKARKSPKPKKP